STAQVRRRLNASVVPVIGSLRLADLHRRDVNRVVDPVIKRGSPIEAAHVLKDLRAMLRWAVARGDLEHSPMDGMDGMSFGRPRERVLTDEEIKALWLAPQGPISQVLRLCLITAQRVGEVAGMTRSELDLKRRVWLLPGSRTKNGHPHSV